MVCYLVLIGSLYDYTDWVGKTCLIEFQARKYATTRITTYFRALSTRGGNRNMGLNWTKVFYTDAYSAHSSLGGHHSSLTIHLSPFLKEHLGSFGYLPNRKKYSTCGWRHSSPVNLASSHALIPRLRVQYPTVCGRDPEIRYRKKANRQPPESGRCPTLIKMADSSEGREGKRKEKPQT